MNTLAKSTAGAALLDWVEELVFAVVLIAVVFTFFFRVVTVSGSSMYPSYLDSDRVLVSSIPGAVEPGDVVVIVNVLEEPIIKRVVATQGQQVDFDEELGAVLIDGMPLDEEAFGLENGVTYLPYSPEGVMDFPQQVPEGCVFVLGDNRLVSEDSRFEEIGMIDERNILGKAIFRLFPPQRLGRLERAEPSAWESGD